MLQSASTEENLGLGEGLQGRLWRHQGSQLRLAPHRHVELEANFVLSGQATYLVGAQPVRLRSRDLLWLFPAQDHVLLECSGDFAMWIAVWKPASLVPVCATLGSQMLLLADPEQILHRRLARPASEFIEALCERIMALGGDPKNRDLLNAALAFLLLEWWTAFGEGEATRAGHTVHPCVERAARLLRDSNPPPSVPELAHQVGLSPSRLSRLFAAQTGQNLTEFRARQCLDRALQGCEDSGVSLSEICWRAGFGSYAQFHRVFVAAMGQSPAKYRATRLK